LLPRVVASPAVLATTAPPQASHLPLASVNQASFVVSGRSRVHLRPTTSQQRPLLQPLLQQRLMLVHAQLASIVHWLLHGLFLALQAHSQAQQRQLPPQPARLAQQDPTAHTQRVTPFHGLLPEQQHTRLRQQGSVTPVSSAPKARNRLDQPPASVLPDKSVRPEVLRQWLAQLVPTRPKQLKEIALHARLATSASKAPQSTCRAL
jgi:hypothetical protein